MTFQFNQALWVKQIKQQRLFGFLGFVICVSISFIVGGEMLMASVFLAILALVLAVVSDVRLQRPDAAKYPKTLEVSNSSFILNFANQRKTLNIASYKKVSAFGLSIKLTHKGFLCKAEFIYLPGFQAADVCKSINEITNGE